MDALTIEDIVDMTDIIRQQGLNRSELRLFALKQDHDIAKAFIAVMRDRHQIEII